MDIPSIFSELRPEKIFSRLWPDGVPLDQKTVFSGLTPARQTQVLRRLAALAITEIAPTERSAFLADACGCDPDVVADVTAVDVMGESKPSFFKVQARWRAARTIEAIAPFANGLTRAPTRFPHVETRLEELLAEEADADAKTLMARIKAEGLAVPSDVTLRRIVREALGRARGATGNLKAGFGTRLILDGTPVRLAIVDRSAAQWAHLTLLFDEASGLILAASLGPVEEGAGMAGRVLDEGRRRLDALRDADDGAKITAVMPSERMFINWARLVRGLETMPDVDRVVSEGERRHGAHAVSTFAKRIGKLELLPRISARAQKERLTPEELAKWPVYPLDEARLLASKAVETNNAPVLKRLSRLRLLKSVSAGGLPLSTLV